MTHTASTARSGNGRLWAIALGLSLVVNTGVVGILGVATLKGEILRRNQPPLAPTAVEVTRVTIFPEMVAAAIAATVPVASAPPTKPAYARTSPDQVTAIPPSTRTFVGERDTLATSDRLPDPAAVPLPSQAGIEKTRQDLETTHSDYQDGGQGETSPAAATPANASAQEETAISAETKPTPGADEVKATPATSAKFLDGPHPVEVPVPMKVAAKPKIQPATAQPNTPSKPTTNTRDATLAFRSQQRKSAIVGSISRTGRSALDVTDSPLGRYQAAISRAVELEWQRNCVRHRDFITPGFLTVRFYVEPSGRVRTVQFVGEMETGEVQKGFTLNAIRDAEIPAMSPTLKKEFQKEPLELIFNFYF